MEAIFLLKKLKISRSLYTHTRLVQTGRISFFALATIVSDVSKVNVKSKRINQ